MKGFYVVVGRELMVQCETMRIAQRQLYRHLQAYPGTRAFICEVLPRVLGSDDGLIDL